MAQSSFAVQIPRRSRHLNTPLFKGSFDGKGSVVFFGRWEAPELLETRGTSFYTVSADEVDPARPDMISYRAYGDVTLFWAIALRNGIFMPLRDLFAGQILVIPHRNDVTEALSRASGSGTRAGVR